MAEDEISFKFWLSKGPFWHDPIRRIGAAGLDQRRTSDTLPGLLDASSSYLELVEGATGIVMWYFVSGAEVTFVQKLSSTVDYPVLRMGMSLTKYPWYLSKSSKHLSSWARVTFHYTKKR